MEGKDLTLQDMREHRNDRVAGVHKLAPLSRTASILLAICNAAQFRLIHADARRGPGKRTLLSLHARIGSHTPHQGERECARRRRQIAAGTLKVG
jgi:hypothetical protein